MRIEKRELKGIGLSLIILLALSIALIYLAVPPGKSDFSDAGDDLLPGLAAAYTDGATTVRLITPTANFYLDPEESLHPALQPGFRAEWAGVISILLTGTYWFDTSTAQLLIDGAPVGSDPVRLTAGRHPIRILYERELGPAQHRLKWKSDEFVWEPVPSSVFFHRSSNRVPEKDLLAEEGRYLVEELGCVNCHAPVSPLLQGRQGPDLTGISSRIKPEWLYHWIENPSAFRPGAAMPAMLDEEKGADLTAYLISLEKARSFDQARPGRDTAAAGRQLYNTLGCAGCHEQEGLSLEGLGSKTDVRSLAAYLKNPRVTDPGGRMPSFWLTGEEAFSLAGFLIQSRLRAFEAPIEPGDPERGRRLVESEGCLNCHRLEDEEVRNQHSAPGLADLSPGAGCLADPLPDGVPRYRFSREQRRALEMFLVSYRRQPDIHAAPVHELYRRIRGFRCTACHQLDSLSPVVRLPEAVPPLTEIGAKLHSNSIETVLTTPAERSAWIDLRMPEFDPGQVKPLSFVKAAGIQPGEGDSAPLPTTGRQSRGINMIGNDASRGGLACIRCHYWGEYEPLGEQAPQLFNVADRIRYEWFFRYILDPGRIYSGTSMPAHFTEPGEEKAAEGIASLWAALSAAEDLPVPDGLVPIETALGEDARPVPENRPVVVRCFMPNATPASIAVGLPGGVSYCFDAGECRLRYAWSGGFIDLTENLLYKTDEDKYTPLARVLGKVFYESSIFPFQFGEGERMPERKFKGYRLIDGYPEFHYRLDDIDVHESILAAAEGNGLVRVFRVSRVDCPLSLMIPAPDGARVTSDIGEFQNGKLEIPRGENIHFRVTVETR